MRSQMAQCIQSGINKKVPPFCRCHSSQAVMLHRNCHHVTHHYWIKWLALYFQMLLSRVLVSQQCLSFSVLFQKKFWCVCDIHFFRFRKACVCGWCVEFAWLPCPYWGSVLLHYWVPVGASNWDCVPATDICTFFVLVLDWQKVLRAYFWNPCP